MYFISGAQNDLEQVTKMAYNQIKHYGMSDCLGMLSFPDETEESEFALKPYSARLATLIDEVGFFPKIHSQLSISQTLVSQSISYQRIQVRGITHITF